MMLQYIRCYFTTGKQKTHLEGPNSPVRFLGWIPEENYMWHVTPFFFFWWNIRPKTMMLPSRGIKLLASQQRAERIQVEASSSGWQEPWELRMLGVVRNKVPERNKDLITNVLSTLQRSLDFILEALERLKIAFSFFSANSYSPKALWESNNSPQLLDCRLEPTFFGRHFTETVLPVLLC